MKQNLFKPFLLAIAVLLAAIPLQAQQMVSNNNDDEVNKVDQSAARAYRPGQVIVKFKDATPIKMRNKDGKFQSSGLSKVDKVLNELGVNEADQLMPLTGSKVNRSVMRAYNGEEVKDRDLSGLYRLRLDAKAAVSVEQAIEKLKELEEVDYAEPNYLVFTMSTDADTYTAEPLYTEQWGPVAINLDQLWAMPKLEGAERPVIAILDTGIDITHPDLADNIWTNTAESTGAEGEDDDNNGYADDVHGWDFINQTAKMADYNGHGTHCAGIAAAVGDNGIGITGANPDAYIMPITIMQSDGTGDIATIIQGIDYATDNGASFLSMSFGSYAYSIAEEQALAKAYSKATLVAAAGNDSRCIYANHHQIGPGPCYPAAFTFVLGVEATNESGRAGFSNWDCDGPIYSQHGEEQLYNYELRAPGVNIYSTYPQGRYKMMNGTSMACPLAAGAISRLMQCKSYEYQVINREVLFGDLIHGANQQTGIMDMMAAYNIKDEDRQPTLWLISTELNDQAEGDGDFRPDAGEIIDFYPTLRNDWGNATNIKLHLGVGENEDETIIECITNDVDFGKNLSSYGKAKSDNPIRFKIRDNCADNRHIRLSLSVTCDETPNPIVYDDFVIVVENGIELGGVIDCDSVLEPKKYIINGGLGIKPNCTLTILPGTTIEVKSTAQVINRGKILSLGEKNNMVYIKGDLTPSDDTPVIHVDSAYYTFYEGGSIWANCYYENCFITNVAFGSGYFKQSNIIDSWRSNAYIHESNNTNIINNKELDIYGQGTGTSFLITPYIQQLIEGTNIFNNIGVSYSIHPKQTDDFSPTIFNHSIYFGSNDFNLIRNTLPIIDCHYDHDILYECVFNNLLLRPSKEAHGIIWKVVVDGYDAQDEFDLLPPLGVGRHKFEVYYNRDDMDTTFTPTITMGVRPPYTQIGIAEDGFWSVKDSVSVYTAYLNITGKLQADGLNRIKVTGGKDYDHFDIPDEYLRFNVLVQAAGSMATGFAAEAGMGNVKLTWNNENNDFEDAMGFNVYRYNYIQVDSLDRWGNPTGVMITVPDTVRLNEMILDLETTSFTDYEVTPGETYYYYYKVLSTDLKEYDISNVVAATPLTSTLGDANASGEVDVADVITTVNYAAGMEPRPFIFEAADVNVDTEIDILDVIGIIKLITNPSANVTTMAEAEAIYSVENGLVYVDCPVELAGVQVMLNATQDATITPTEVLNGFERVGAWLGENSYVFLAYNMADRTIPAGKHALLTIGDATLTDLRLADKQGHNVYAYVATPTVIDVIPADGKAVRHPGIYDLMGRKISSQASDLDRLAPGIYIVNGQKVVKK